MPEFRDEAPLERIAGIVRISVETAAGGKADVDIRAVRREDAPRLREALAAAGEAPLRILADAFNARVQPECRRGSGYVRAALHGDPRVRRTAPGRYALPGGLQAGLPL